MRFEQPILSALPGPGLGRGLVDRARVRSATRVRWASDSGTQSRTPSTVAATTNPSPRPLCRRPIQKLAALQLNLERIRISLAESDPARESVDQATQKLRVEVHGLRRTMAALRSPVLGQRGLASAIEDYLSERADGSEISWNVEVALAAPLSTETETSLYRVTQEAVNNAVRHARARSITVHVNHDEGATVMLRISDDGTGFDQESAVADGRGFGLLGMRGRLAIVGGRLDITSTKADTEVVAFIPDARPAELAVAG